MAYWFRSSRLAPRSGGAARRGGPACSPAAARYSLKPRWSSPLQHLVTLDRPQPREVLARPVRPFAVHQTPPRQELRDVVARLQTAVRRWPGQQGGRRPPDGRQVARAFSNPTPHGPVRPTQAGQAALHRRRRNHGAAEQDARDQASRWQHALELPFHGGRQGISKSTVHRVWTAFGIQPHRQKHFKHSPIRSSPRRSTTSSDSTSTRPKARMVLCVDEKSQTQALERTGNRDRPVGST